MIVLSSFRLPCAKGLTACKRFKCFGVIKFGFWHVQTLKVKKKIISLFIKIWFPGKDGFWSLDLRQENHVEVFSSGPEIVHLPLLLLSITYTTSLSTAIALLNERLKCLHISYAHLQALQYCAFRMAAICK